MRVALGGISGGDPARCEPRAARGLALPASKQQQQRQGVDPSRRGGTRTLLAVGVLGLDGENGLLALLHGGEGPVPALDNLA
jgi:hypothetical protein